MAIDCEILLITIIYGNATDGEKLPFPYTPQISQILKKKKRKQLN